MNTHSAERPRIGISSHAFGEKTDWSGAIREASHAVARPASMPAGSAVTVSTQASTP